MYQSPHMLPCLLAVILPLSMLVWLTHYLLTLGSKESYLSPIRCFTSILIPSLLAFDSVKKKKLDHKALIVAFVLGFVETLSNLCMIATSVAFFLACTRASKFKQKSKVDLIEEDSRNIGRRNWIQVIANGGVGLEVAILMLIERGPANEMPINFLYDYFPSWLSLAFLGSMACACGDTLASELAPVLSSSEPVLVTNPLRRVPKGTDGGVTILGLFCSLLGGLVCGISYYILTIVTVDRNLLETSPPQWPLIVVGGVAGLLGSLIDSILGATVQFSGLDKASGKIVSRKGSGVVKIAGAEILDNHSVNLVSTLLTALVAPYLGSLLWQLAS